MDKGAFNHTALTGQAYFDWLGKNEQMHRVLMKEAGFLAKRLRRLPPRGRRWWTGKPDPRRPLG
jgi:hypothetical protein